jgi:putative transposase
VLSIDKLEAVSSLGVMARKLRVEYEGAIYHVMSRGDRREPIFRNDADRVLFLETLSEVCAKTGWQVHAYCLMDNHFHLVIETPNANLVAGMKWLLGTYTGRFNRRHQILGHLFSGRYKALIVDGSGSGYLRSVCDYVHLNPARAKLLGEPGSLRDYRWSSYCEYLKSPGKRAGWLRTDRVLGEMGIGKESAAGRKAFEKQMELRRWEEQPEEWKRLRRGWCLGDQEFRKELLEMMSERMGAEHYGQERHESAEARAERVLAEELKRARWTEGTLAQKRKGDPKKVKMAQRLRRETTMTLKWIAQRLKMGTNTHLAHLLYWERKV